MTSKLKDFANILRSEIKCLYGARDSLSSLSELIIIFESPRTAVKISTSKENSRALVAAIEYTVYTHERAFKCV